MAKKSHKRIKKNRRTAKSQQSRSQRNPKRQWLWLVGIGVLVVGTLAVLSLSSPKSSSTPIISEEVQVPLEPTTEEKNQEAPRNLGNLQGIPTLSSYSSRVHPAIAAQNPRSPEYGILLQRFQVLIQEHPEKMISQDLNQKILNHEITFSFQETSGGAAFVEVDLTLVTSLPEGINKDEPVLALHFDPTSLAQLGSPESVVEAMLVIYHEYQHYLQYIDGPEEVREMFRGHDPDGLLGERRCEILWDLESKAHYETFMIAKKWGVSDLIYQGGLTEEDFDKSFLASTGTGFKGVYPEECIPIWEEIVNSEE